MASSLKHKYWIICTLLSVSLVFVGALLPALGAPLMFLYAVPTLILSRESGLLRGLTSAFVAALILFLGGNLAIAVLSLVSFSIQGALLGAVARDKRTGAELVLIGVSISLLCKITTVLLFYGMTGANPLSPGAEEIEKAVVAMWQSHLSGLSAGEAQLFVERLRSSVDSFVQLVPSILIMFSCVEVLAGYYISSRFHKKIHGEGYFSLPEFGEWNFPKSTIIAVFVSFLCELVSLRQPDAVFVGQIAANLGAVTRTLLVIQGLAVAYGIMTQRGFSRASRIILVVLAIIFDFFRSIFFIVGFIDIGYDLRKRLGGNDK